MRVATFAQIEAEFIARVNKMVWCDLATIDRQEYPRSRIVHSIWDGASGWIAAWRQSPKARDIAVHPHVSLAYVTDIVRPVYVRGLARWADDKATKRHVWDLFSAALPPLGYDPVPIYGSVDAPEFGVLRITPLHIELGDVSGMGERRVVWHAADQDDDPFTN
jgi:general stress protein 26